MPSKGSITTKIEGEKLVISNPGKILFPESGIRKVEMIEYYRQVAPYILPHLRNRPISLERFPEGAGGEMFYQKEIPSYFPTYFERINVNLEKEGEKLYGMVNNKASLVYLANMATIIHTWTSNVHDLRKPDTIIWDLDPMNVDFDLVKTAAKLVKVILEEIGLPSVFLKLTGSRGIHVVIPVKPEHDVDITFHFSKNLSEFMEKKLPSVFTTAFSKARRGKKIYLDYLRNRYAQTAVAPLVVRAIENAPVAMPIHWEQLDDEALHPQQYTIKNALQFLQTDDPWKDFFAKPNLLDDAIERIQKLHEENNW